MPQLNPSPFFAILLFSWCILLTLIPVKVLAHALPNEPAPQDSELPKTQPYNWQWL